MIPALTMGVLIQLVVTLAVPIVPIGYRHCYVKKGNIALDELRSSISVTNVGSQSQPLLPDSNASRIPKSANQNCISRGEPGFRIMESAVCERGLLSEEAEKFCLASGDVAKIAGALDLTLPGTSGSTYNAIFYVEYTNGRTERLIYHPNDPHQTVELIEAYLWIRYAATIQSESITIFLAFMLFLVSILV